MSKKTATLTTETTEEPTPEPQPEPTPPPEKATEFQTSSTETAKLTPTQFRNLKLTS